MDSAERHIRVDEALAEFLAPIKPVSAEYEDVLSSLNRILAEDVVSKLDVPSRPRSTRDGYALKSSSLGEAGSRLKIIGDVRIGISPKIVVRSGETVRIATGSYVPTGADAVVMKEYAEAAGEELIVNRPVKTGENILSPGEDISRNSTVMRSGEPMRPHHIALLTQIGAKRLRVFRRPRIAFFSTGDELVDARARRSSKDPKIYDISRPFIQSMIEELGASPVDLGIARDEYGEIRKRMILGLKSDALLLTAGSSVGERDFVSKAAASISGVKILAHGVAMRPSSPTGLCIYKGRPLIMLPGFPTSTMISFFVFAVPAILRLSGAKNTSTPMIKARLLDDYGGKKGIRHYVRVCVEREGQEYTARIATPTEAQYTSWMKNANGIAVIGEEAVPVRANDIVDVFLIASIRQV